MHNNGTGLKNTPRPGTPVEIFGACCSPWKMLLIRQFVALGTLGTPLNEVSRCPPTPILRPYPHRQQFSGRGRSSFPFSSICSFPRKNVQKVGGYHTKKLRRSQLLPNPTLEVPITLADARGHDALASAQNMGTSNVGLGSK